VLEREQRISGAVKHQGRHFTRHAVSDVNVAAARIEPRLP